MRLERVEWFRALAADPVRPQKRRAFARRAGESQTARPLRHARQRNPLFQSSPAIHQNEYGQNSKPGGLQPKCQGDESCHADKPDNRGRHQAASSPHRVPQECPQNLAPIQRIDGQDVKDQQPEIYEPNRLQKCMNIGRCLRPAGGLAQRSQAPTRSESAPHLRAAPRQCSKAWLRARRRVHIRYAAQRPQHDLI